MREEIDRAGVGVLRLRGTDWFAWATCGGSSSVIMASETGIAEVVVTPDRAFIVTTEIERARLRDEEVPPAFEIVALPWSDPGAADAFVGVAAGGRAVMSDRPHAGERLVPASLLRAKRKMDSEERDRYRVLGLDAAAAMTEALGAARPDWTELRLAGEGARSLWSRGIEPTLVLVAGARRAEVHRHPVATESPLGDRAMMVFCGRRHGLYANLTRFVSFREPTDEEAARFDVVARIEAAAFRASRPGRTMADLYDEIVDAYAAAGRAGETALQHFGGITGYLSREAFARPDSAGEASTVLEDGSAIAWNPTLPGTKIEDTALVTADGIEILTVDPAWPARTVDGRARPDVWVRT